MGHMCSARVQRPCPKSAGGQVERRYVRHRPEETALYDVVERHQGAFPGSCAMSLTRICAVGGWSMGSSAQTQVFTQSSTTIIYALGDIPPAPMTTRACGYEKVDYSGGIRTMRGDTQLMDAVQLAQELIALESMNPGGSETACAQRLGGLLDKAGFTTSYHEVAPGRTSVVASRGGSPGSQHLRFAGHIQKVVRGRTQSAPAHTWKSCASANPEAPGVNYGGKSATNMFNNSSFRP
jgi:hypothetical protein